jgi:hypothetical protein
MTMALQFDYAAAATTVACCQLPLPTACLFVQF